MIVIDRSVVTCPDVLDLKDPTSIGAKETARAKEYFDDPDNTKAPDYKAYSHDRVKLALMELFNAKCAYCEAKVIQARDIEHFRPKGRIDPGTGSPYITPGYAWLAATWDNLLLSCPDCNQSRRKLARDEEGGWTFEKESTGKLDQFPLTDESARVRDYDVPLSSEAPLLLNPCVDKPKQHLRFDKEGQIIARQLNFRISEMAEVSIIVYALARTTLNEARKAVYLDMLHCWDALVFVDRMLNAAPASARADIRRQFAVNESRLNSFVEDGAEFSAMTRQLSRRWFRQELPEMRARLDAKYPP